MGQSERCLRAGSTHLRQSALLQPRYPVNASDGLSLRREFHLFLLLSGHRPDPIKCTLVEQVDFRTRILHVPKPKGGEAKAFDIPLSRAMIRCLIRAIRIGRVLYPAQSEWLRQQARASGWHLAEHKENREALSKWGNDLRQTFRTVAQAAGVPELDVHLLMNHSISGVNAGYITRNKLLRDHLRQQQEAISRKIIDAGQPRPNGKTHALATWPMLPSRRCFDVRAEAPPAGAAFPV
jgi:hypothetical protein